jgi:hypothetical protein
MTMKIPAAKSAMTRKATLLFLSFLCCCPDPVRTFVLVQRPLTVRGISSCTLPPTRASKTRSRTPSQSIHIPEHFRCSNRKQLPSHPFGATPVSAEELQLEQPRRRVTIWNDFLYGAAYVHSQYLHLFWEFYGRRSLMLVLPAFLVLVTIEFLVPSIGTNLFAVLEQGLRALFLVSSFVGGILQLPLDVFRWVCDATPPAFIIPMLDFLPSGMALRLVRLVLFLQHELKLLGQSALFTSVAVLIWRPMIEEIQYRYLLNRIIGKGRGKIRQEKLNKNGDSNHPASSSKVEFIPMDADAEAANTPQVVTEVNGSSESESEIVLPDAVGLSRSLLLSSFFFATTRLAWLCARPNDAALLPFSFLQSATSPYVWSVGFLQSAMSVFSSRALSELAPLLQKGLMLLAVHQSVSTFFVALHLFSPLYQQRGLAASVGAHVAWTVGKMTIPIRLLWRLTPGTLGASTGTRVGELKTSPVAGKPSSMFDPVQKFFKR